MRLHSRKSSKVLSKRFPLMATGSPCSKVTLTSSGVTTTSLFQCATPMIGATMRIPVSRRSRSFASCVAPRTFASVEYAFSVPIL